MAGKKKIKEEVKADTRVIDIVKFQKNENKVIEYKIDDGAVFVTISKSIPLDEAYDLVNAVVDNCFMDGTYSPIYRNISIARALDRKSVV